MTYKPNLSRMARLAAGSRRPAPGQDPLREEELRIELAEEFKPHSLIEKIWVEDIAYRVASIEVIRAQMAGFRARVVKTTYKELVGADAFDDDLICGWDKLTYSANDRAVLAQNFDHGFMATDRENFFAMPPFAVLMGSMAQDDLAQLRQLQVYEHEEVRERDRIVNQFERRRRQAMRHAIEMIEARRRAGLPDEGCDLPVSAAEATVSHSNGNGEVNTTASSEEDAIDADTGNNDEGIACAAAGVDEDQTA